MSEENGRKYNDVVETTDEDGKVHYFEKVEEVDVDGTQYALLIYQGGDDEDEASDDEDGFEEEYVVMKVLQDEDGAVYEYIDDEAEFKKVVKALEALDYDFDLSEDDDDDEDDDSDDDDHPAGEHVHGPNCHHG
jgi:Protein of unknown function (DUF1292)